MHHISINNGRVIALALVKVGGAVGQKKGMNTGMVLRGSEGRAAKNESLVTWSCRS